MATARGTEATEALPFWPLASRLLCMYGKWLEMMVNRRNSNDCSSPLAPVLKLQSPLRGVITVASSVECAFLVVTAPIRAVLSSFLDPQVAQTTLWWWLGAREKVGADFILLTLRKFFCKIASGLVFQWSNIFLVFNDISLKDLEMLLSNFHWWSQTLLSLANKLW